MSKPNRRAGRMTLMLAGTALWSGLAIAALAVSTAKAQDVDLGLRVFKQKAQCILCHGWAGDGDGAMDNPAPSIRVSKLDRRGLIETIRCGRPGTAMPFHFRAAYGNNAATSCYGMTEADIGAQKPSPTRAFLTEAEIEAVAAFVEAWILGRGKSTVQECEFFFGAGNVSCPQYK